MFYDLKMVLIEVCDKLLFFCGTYLNGDFIIFFY